MIRAAVLGKPVHHSLSPLVHGLIYRELDIRCEYGLFEVDVSDAERLIRASFSKPDEEWRGFSLTMPLKEVGFSLPFPIEDRANEARSINTITPKGSFNTDISGFERVFRTEGLEPTEVVIFGNGATARSALIAIDSLKSVSDVTLYRRSKFHDELLPHKRRVPLVVKSMEEFGSEEMNAMTLVISTLPGSSQDSITEKLSGFEGTLIDVSYAPWPSLLANVVPGRVISGLNLLVAQAVDQARIFSGLPFEEDEMYRKVLSSTIASLGSSR